MRIGVMVGRAGRSCLQLLRCGLRLSVQPGLRDAASGRTGQPEGTDFHKTIRQSLGDLEKFGISFKIEARKKILPQAYT
jgi:hypothetical protein